MSTNKHLKQYNYQYFDTSVYGLEPFAHSSPRIGECASDFQAKLLDGTDVKLSDFKGKRIILETGSLTCPMFGGNIKGMNALADKYADEGTVFLILYTREAHPAGKTPAHQSDAEKLSVAARTAELISNNRLFLVDDIYGSAHRLWGEFPNSLWVINPDGRVEYRSDWNQVEIVKEILEAQNLDDVVSKLSEHNMPDMSKPFGPIKWMVTKAGWRAIWDIISQHGSMKDRHREVDGFYEDKQYVAGRDTKVRACW